MVSFVIHSSSPTDDHTVVQVFLSCKPACNSSMILVFNIINVHLLHIRSLKLKRFLSPPLNLATTGQSQYHHQLL